MAGDAVERTYYTGDGAPKMTYSPIATTGAAVGFPKDWRTLGVPAPSAAPTVSLGVGGGCATGLQVATDWVYRFSTNLTEAGPPSPVSVALLVCPGQTISISGLATVPPGGGTYTIAKREIFQSVTGSNGVVKYRLAHTINNATDTSASFAITVPLTQLLDSTGWDPPPSDMHSIISLPNGNTAGLSGFDVRFSEQYLPHAWPHFTPLEFRGVGLGAFGGTLVILTEGHPYMTSGATPEILVDNMEKIAISQGCSSKRSIANGTDGVYYSSPDGLVFIGTGGYEIITDKFMTRDDWQALVPSSITGRVIDNRYYGFYDTGTVQGGFIISKDGMINISTIATAAHVDILTDGLYLQVGDNIMHWDAGTGSISYTWATENKTPQPVNMSWCRVRGESVSGLVLKYFVDNVLKMTKTLANERPFRLPAGFKGSILKIEMTGTGSFTEIVLANTQREI